MTQYDCALCHLPTPSPLLLLSHLEVLVLLSSATDHYHLDHHLHLIVTLIRLATDSAFVQTWAKEAIWSWKAEVSTSFPSSPPTAHSCPPSSGLRRLRGFIIFFVLIYVVFLHPDTNLCGEKVEVRKVESFKLRLSGNPEIPLER